MGGGGGFFPTNIDSDTIKQEVQRSLDTTQEKEFDAQISGRMNELLKQYNDRDETDLKRKLDLIKKLLNQDIENMLDVRFGGSISKNTYVDGLSDVDTLVLINNTELLDKTPEQVQNHFLNKLKNGLAGVKEVDKGNLAVTVKYNDKTEIQLLPAVKLADGYKIASPDGKSWSKIDPQGFTKHLTKLNKDLNCKIVPAIKIIKAINTNFPSSRQLSGYHIESLAIEVFKKYSGEKTIKSVIETFFDKARSTVLKQIKDKSKQSVHVDDYLGGNRSDKRKAVSHQLDITCRKIQSANKICSINAWNEILGDL